MHRKVVTIAMSTIIAIILIVVGWHLFSSNKIIGEWSGVDKTGNSATFIFHKDGTGTMISRNNKLSFHYELNNSKNPFWLDLDLKIPNRQIKMKFIGKYEDDNNLQLYTFFDNNRPNEFPKSKEGIIYLKRVK